MIQHVARTVGSAAEPTVRATSRVYSRSPYFMPIISPFKTLGRIILRRPLITTFFISLVTEWSLYFFRAPLSEFDWRWYGLSLVLGLAFIFFLHGVIGVAPRFLKKILAITIALFLSILLVGNTIIYRELGEYVSV